MQQNFTIPELLALAGDLRFQPGLAAAVNLALRARSQEEYTVALQSATEIALGYQPGQVATRKDYGTSSTMPGMPLFQPLLLKGQDGDEDLLLESAVLDIDQPKNIVKTINQGRDVSVKEFINDGDYELSVSGILCNNQPVYPLELVKRFWAVMKYKKPVEIEHELLNALGVYQIVVTDRRLAQTTFINCQKYTFSACNDEPLELKINDLPLNSAY